MEPGTREDGDPATGGRSRGRAGDGSRGRDLVERLKRGEVLIADGALGTQLIARGLEPGEAPESWNLTRPEILEEIAALYLEAGSEIISTNTFGGSSIRLAVHGLEDRMEDVNRSAVAAVRRAVGDRALILGSVGPCGRLLLPHGDAHPSWVRSSFASQMKVLVDAGVDILGIETMTDLQEAFLALAAALEATGVSPPFGDDLTPHGKSNLAAGGSVPISVTLTFERTPKGFFTIMGNSVSTAAAILKVAGADIIGANCGRGIVEMVDVAGEFRSESPLPLLLQPNAGLPSLEGDRLVYHETPEDFAARARDLVAAGASIVGGCCGTTPEHIRLVKRALRG
jgi:5-methyltetrahydrofolate--homocysteine methyltransferase